MQEVVKIWIFIFLSKMVGKIKIFKNIQTSLHIKRRNFCRTPEEN